MTKAAIITIGIGKECRTLYVDRMYLIDELLDKLPVNTSVTITSIEKFEFTDEDYKLIGINLKEEEV